MIDKNNLISTGEIIVVGRLVDASNATLFAHIKDCDPNLEIIYKPVAGERPLWDSFPSTANITDKASTISSPVAAD
jgi:hypothetical protein